MAKTYRVWGIDIGQCGLKALHCVREGDQLLADAFDYVEYPKILSQPEAEPEELIADAIKQFLSRNEITGEDKVAISVPGQSGLAKFFKPPPVDVKKIPEIVKYEAKQQIPFPLEEVIWDFQQMVGGAEVDGFAIDTEVGLFAMKRDQVFRHLRPFEKAEIELDVVQLSPLSIYNFVAYDVLTDGPSPDEFDPDDPPESIVVLSMGTDSTDLVITNGFRVWQRSIPLGGSHFTKQLTKELKLTFAKAEHLKRNARQAEDPKTVFQAMRPIFNDMVTEIQRSIGYFQSIDRQAKIRGVVLLGNTVKLPGLQQYISKNLGYEVINFSKFNLLNGNTVLSAPAFHDNVLTYGVCYGLCLQGADLSRLSTNLLPREIMTQRIIRAKKPWAVASVGALMLACAFNFFFNYNVWSKVREDREVNSVSWQQAEGKVDSASSQSSGYQSTFSTKQAQLKFVEEIGEEVVGATDRRLLWLELLKALNAALPWTESLPDGTPITPGQYVDYKTLPFDQRKELYIEYVESEYFTDLSTWFTPLEDKYYELQRELGNDVTAMASGGAGAPAVPAMPGASPLIGASVGTDTGTGVGPTGAGWVIEFKGYHYHNSDLNNSGATHLRTTLLKNLEDGSIDLPIDNGRAIERFTFKELGISHPVLVLDEGEPRRVQVRNPDFEGEAGMMPGGYPGEGYEEEGYGGLGMPGMSAPPGFGTAMGSTGTAKKKEGEEEEEEKTPPFFTVPQYSFLVQFCWQEKTLSERLKAREEKRLLDEAAAAAAAAEPGVPVEPGKQPGQPAMQPGQPGQPGMQPGQPAMQPGQPGQPGMQPGQPAMQPGQPGQPGMQPGQPAMQPGQPGQPGMQPGQPAMQPGQPGQPAMQPGQPAMQPGQPAMQPGQPGQPAMQPGQPAMQPGQPAMQPGQPAMQPGQPGQPGMQPGQPGQPGPTPPPGQ